MVRNLILSDIVEENIDVISLFGEYHIKDFDQLTQEPKLM